MKQQAIYKIIGMQKDVADSGMDKQHAFDLHNIRFRNTDTNSVTAMMNEEGNMPAVSSGKASSEITFEGIVIGSTTINDTAVVFTHASGSSPDHIYLIEPGVAKGTFTLVHYFAGDLSFDTEHPIECTVYFENEEVQKVYWVDGKNCLRYANIADRNGGEPWTYNLMFDSVPQLHLQEEVTITRNSTGGVFPSCTVQWCFTYLNRYGAESNIVWTSPIYYSSPDDRGGAPGENCANSFTIQISNYETDGRFDYIRLYHIVHTSLDTEAEVRRVADIPFPSTAGQPVVYTDTNTTGETVDPNELLYLGGISVIPHTIEQKSNTLFLGNIETNYKYLNNLFRDSSGNTVIPWGNDLQHPVQFSNQASSELTVPADRFSGYYSHENQLKYSASEITTFKRGERYRFGFQAQDNTGRWSDVWWVGDYKNDTASAKFDSTGHLNVVHATYDLNSNIVGLLLNNGYIKVRPVVVYPEPWERNIYTEGLINPTVYNAKDRLANMPFAQSSWFLRPFSPIDMASIDGNNSDPFGNISGMPYPETAKYNAHLRTYGGNFPFLSIDVCYNGAYVYDFFNHGSWAEFRHNHPLGDSQQHNGEIQSMYTMRTTDELLDNTGYSLNFPYLAVDANLTDAANAFVRKYSDFYYVDQSIVTMNSADIQFDQTLQATDFGECKMRIIGFIPMHSFMSSVDIMTNTPPNKFYTDDDDSVLIPQGFYNSESVGAKMEECGFGWKSLISAGLWHDDLAHTSLRTGHGYNNPSALPIGFAVYPWQCSGSLNNDSVGIRRVYPSDDNADDKEESKQSIGDNYISAELKTKTLSNIHYSHNTCFIDSLTKALSLDGMAYRVLDEQQVSLTKIKEPNNSGFGDLHYFGSVDSLITPINEIVTEEDANQDINPGSVDDYPATRYGGFPRMVGSLPYCRGGYENISHLAFSSPYTLMSVYNTLTGYSGYNVPVGDKKFKSGGDKTIASIPIKYKSCNHIVFAFDYYEDDGDILQPYLGWNGKDDTELTESYDKPFFAPETLKGLKNINLFASNATFDGCRQEQLASMYNGFVNHDTVTGFLYYGQLYREQEVSNKFGGTSFEAIEQNVWLPAGKAVKLVDSSSASLVWSVGDTYYQRYDALRTYPFTEEDLNKVVDIASFMTETHINIDGRYDKNRGLKDNNNCRPTNFNKMNYVYSQRDNFFTYHTLNPNKVNLDNFEYSFTWSMQKVAGAMRDEWTRVTLANTYDCDGNKGSITSINRLDNNLVAFQESGVAQILYNENVQIQGSEGVPIELANSGKVTGVRYFSTEVGCQNKWSVAVFPNGIYWVDGRMKEFCMLGEGIAQVSTTKLMSSWFKQRNDFITSWKPYQWNGFISHRDITTGELFLTSNDVCLCYDTITGEFTSFYDYQGTYAMFTIDGTVLTIAPSNDTMKLWMHRSNILQHCNFYGIQYPFWAEIVCNGNNQNSDYGMDKIFDNLNWRADVWEWRINDDNVYEWNYKPFTTYTDISGFDNYQTFSLHFNPVNGTGTEQLSHPVTPINHLVNLRKKFKIWYTTIPRADGTRRDRIRDTWCHIRLTGDTSVSNYRHIMHDLTVTYFIP